MNASWSLLYARLSDYIKLADMTGTTPFVSDAACLAASYRADAYRSIREVMREFDPGLPVEAVDDGS